MRDEILRSAKILIVDDEAAVNELLQRILRQEGYRHIQSTSDSTKACDLFAAFQPDLVLLDLIMPNLDGFQVLEQLRPHLVEQAYLPIVVVSGVTSLEAKQKALESGAADFVNKPYDPIEIALRVFNLLETRFLYRQLLDQNRLLQAEIVERQRAQAALQANHNLLRAVTDGCDDAVFVKDLQGRYLMINAAGARWRSKTAEEIIGMVDTDLFSPETARIIREADLRILAADTTQTWEETTVEDGKTRVHLVTKGVYRNQQESVGIFGVGRDITARKQAEKELQARTQQQAAVAELGLRALTGIDVSTLLNEAAALVAQTLEVEYCKVLELLSDGQALLLRAGVGWKEGFVGRATVSAGVASQAGYTLLSHEPVIVEDLRTEMRFSGPPLLHDHKVVSGMSVIIYDHGQDRPFGVLGTHTTSQRTFTKEDVHFLQAVANVLALAIKRQRVEAALQESHQFLQSTLDALSAHIAILNESGTIVAVNAAWHCFAQANGILDAADEVGANYLAICDAATGDGSESVAEVAAGIRAVTAKRRDYFALEYPCHSPQEERWFVVRVTRFEGNGLVRVVVAHENISERKQAEEAFQKATAEAERANRAKSEFLARMSHELRTPLNAILGFGQLFELEKLDEEERENVEEILRAGKHLLHLINEVLDIARIESGRMALSIEAVNVQEVVDEVLGLVKPLATERNIRIKIMTETTTYHVQADRQRLKQVLLNLTSNAVKYNRQGGDITLSWEEIREESSEAPAALPPSWMRIAVTDTGPGIAAQNLEKVFEPFERIGAEQSGVEGSGIGLAISKRLVELMGGAVSVQSVVGRGSTFRVELPRIDDPLLRLEAHPPTFDAASGQRPSPVSRHKTVLYIEDNLSNLKLIQRIMEHRPEINLIAAMQGSLGLDLAREHRPDLVLLDFHLPDIMGDEVLRRLQAEPETQGIPVVMISADATPGQIERLRAAGVRDYLTKPLDVRRFLQVLEEILTDEED